MAVGMGLFFKTKKIDGWLTINIQTDGIYLVHVNADAAEKPQVVSVAFYPCDTSQVAKTLEKVAREFHLERYHCTNLLNPGEYQLLSVEAPDVPRDELKTAVRWRIKDVLDFPVDDAVIDVLDMPVDKDTPERRGGLFAVAASGQSIRYRQSLFEAAEVPLNVIDIPEMAQRNISALMEPAGRGLALLACDNAGLLLTITFEGELCLSRRFDVTLAQLVQVDAVQRSAVFDRITLELQRSFDHFESQFRFIAVAKLMLAPFGDGGADLQEYLSGNLYMPVETVKLEKLFDLARVPDLQQARSQQVFFSAIGAALRQSAGSA